MKPILLSVAILLAGGSAYWGMTVKTKLEEASKETVQLKDDNTVRERELKTTTDNLVEMEKSRDLAIQAQILAASELEKATEENNKLVSDLEALNQDLAKVTGELNALLNTDDGRDPEKMLAEVDTLKASIKEKEDRKTELATLIEAATTKLKPLEDDYSKLTTRLAKYNASVARNSVEYAITAVDPKWGFVILNAGESAGLDSTMPLLVIRNGQRQAILKITQIEKNQTVADIVPNSIKPGNTLQVGDKIIPLRPQG